MRSVVLSLPFAFSTVVLFAAVGAATGGFEIKNADRGLVHRVKVLYDGRTIDTIVLLRGRTQASTYCCTTEGCKEIEAAATCSAFKMTCDANGACWASGPRTNSSASVSTRAAPHS